MTKSKHAQCLLSLLSTPLLPLPLAQLLHPSIKPCFPNLKACTCTDLYTHTHASSTYRLHKYHTHLQTHGHIQTHSPRKTFSPSCLDNQVVTASKMRHSGSVASTEPPETLEVFFSHNFTISGQIGFLLKEAHHLANFGKVCERFFWCFKSGCVLSLSKIDDFCRLKCLTENVVPNWTSPFTCGAAVRCLPTLKRLAVPVLIINPTLCYRYVNQKLSLMLWTDMRYSRLFWEF